MSSVTPLESQINDKESSMTSNGFLCGIENLWVPEHGWTEKDEKASDNPHSPQYLASLDVFLRFFVLKKMWVHLAASMQAGKTGVINSLIRLMMITANFRKLLIAPSSIFLITGMSDNAWKKQTRERMPGVIHENIQHSGGLDRVKSQLIKKAKGGVLQNVLIVIDESHFASSKMNRTSKYIYDTLKELCPLSDWEANNIRLLTISATDPSLILAAGSMPQSASVVFLQTTDAYQSIRSLLTENRIHDTFDLKSESTIAEVIRLIQEWYSDTPLYHIIRPRPSQMALVERSLEKFLPHSRILKWDAASNAAAARSENTSTSSTEYLEDINMLLESEPDMPTFILLKNMFYASKTLNDTYVGVLHDRASSKDDTNLYRVY
jgi:hypothetical protein